MNTAETSDDPSVKFSKLVSRIIDEENVPFPQAWSQARERFPSLYEKLPVVQQSAAKFRDLVRDTMSSDGCDLITAWQRCSTAYPELYAWIGDKTPVASMPAAIAAPAPGAAAGRYSPLLGCDISQVTPAQARAAFRDEVERHQKEKGIDFTAAWNQVAQTHPDVLAKSGEDTRTAPETAEQEQVALPNALTGLPAPRGGKPLILPALGLPADTTDEEYDVAWNANGRQHVRRDDDAILTALVAHLMGKYRLSAEAAKREAAGRFPQLWAVAGDKPVTQAPLVDYRPWLPRS
jgi:hypothetical protein